MKLQDGATSEGEAAACAARIADICLKHNLEIGSVQLEQDETEASEAEYLSTGVYQTHYVWLQSAVDGMFNVGSYRQGCWNRSSAVTVCPRLFSSTMGRLGGIPRANVGHGFRYGFSSLASTS